MNTTPNEPPEWEIFNRVEHLEKLKPTVEDTQKIATAAFLLFFMYAAVQKPAGARKLKDLAIAWLKRASVSRETISQLEITLLLMCDLAENQ